MRAWFGCSDDGRVNVSTTFEEYASGMTAVEVDDGFDFGHQGDYKLIDGELVYDGAQTAAEEAAQKDAEYATRQQAQLQTFNLMTARSQVAAMAFESEAEIAAVNTLLPDWVPDGHAYKQGDAFQWEKRTWRVSQDTTSQSIYPPDVSEALYYEIVVAPDGIIIYRPAKGKYDSVRKGELRHYPDADGPVYRSKVDWNAYAPDVVPDNWELV